MLCVLVAVIFRIITTTQSSELTWEISRKVDSSDRMEEKQKSSCSGNTEWRRLIPFRRIQEGFCSPGNRTEGCLGVRQKRGRVFSVEDGMCEKAAGDRAERG